MEKYKFEASIFWNMRVIYYLSWLLVLVYSCTGDKHNFRIEVDVEGAGNSFIYLARRTLTGVVPVDSALPDKSGKYVLEGYAGQADFYIVYPQQQHYVNLIIHPGDRFKVITTAGSFDRDYLVEGSKDSRLIQKMVQMQTRTLEKITELSMEYENSKGSEDFSKIKERIDKEYDQVVTEHRKFSIKLIEENPESLAGLMALYQQLGRNAPVFDYKKDFRYYEMVDSCLSPLFPTSEAIIDLNRKVTELRELLMLETGSPAPEISLPDQTGQVISLSSLKGKKVLLVFWASWSSQSLQELTKLARLYPVLTAEGLEYFQVSLDRTRDSWLKIVQEKAPRGIHVSDLKYWDSPVIGLYHIKQLPLIFLIDERGVITQRSMSADEITAILGK